MKDVYLDTYILLRLYEAKPEREDAEKIVLLAKQDKLRVAVSDWVINECVGAVQRKRNENKLSREEASKILDWLATLIEGKIEEVNLSLYPVTQNVVRDSVVTSQDVMSHSAGDAIHVYTADKTGCHYFVAADKGIASKIKNSGSRYKLVAVDIGELNDMLTFYSNFD